MSLRPRRSRPQGRTRVHRPRVRTRSLRTRLLVLVSATLVLVCATMALTTAFVQRAYLMGDLDGRVAAAASRSLGGASLHPEIDDDLGFLDDNGHATGLLAARLDEDGAIVAAEVSLGGSPKGLTAAQTAARRTSRRTAPSTPGPCRGSAPTGSPPSKAGASASSPGCPWTTCSA